MSHAKSGKLRRSLVAVAALPLVFALAACEDKPADTSSVASQEALPKIPAPAGKSWTEVITKLDNGGYRMGNPDAPIKLVEYASLTCGHCADFTTTSGPELKDTFIASGRVSLELHNFVRDGIDITAAQLTRCGSPESYFALTDQFFANQAAILQKAQTADQAALQAAMSQPEDKRGLAIAELLGLVDFFSARGVSKDQAQKCLANFASAEALAKNAELATTEHNITGTPTFLLNGQKLDANTWPDVKAQLEKAGAR